MSSSVLYLVLLPLIQKTVKLCGHQGCYLCKRIKGDIHTFSSKVANFRYYGFDRGQLLWNEVDK